MLMVLVTVNIVRGAMVRIMLMTRVLVTTGRVLGRRGLLFAEEPAQEEPDQRRAQHGNEWIAADEVRGLGELCFEVLELAVGQVVELLAGLGDVLVAVFFHPFILTESPEIESWELWRKR